MKDYSFFKSISLELKMAEEKCFVPLILGLLGIVKLNRSALFREHKSKNKNGRKKNQAVPPTIRLCIAVSTRCPTINGFCKEGIIKPEGLGLLHLVDKTHHLPMTGQPVLFSCGKPTKLSTHAWECASPPPLKLTFHFCLVQAAGCLVG